MKVRTKNFLPSLLVFAVFVVGILVGMSPANAQQKHKRLNKDIITEFIHKTSDMTSGANLEMSSEDIVEFLEIHLDKKARFKSTMKYNIPGYPAQETSMSLDKEDFIKSIQDGAQSMEDYENEIRIKMIKIAKNGKKATVQTEGFETGIMPVSTDGVTTQNVPIEGRSSCNQIISLGKKGVIQMYSAQCTTEITFLSY